LLGSVRPRKLVIRQYFGSRKYPVSYRIVSLLSKSYQKIYIMLPFVWFTETYLV